ncbi:hypothetical protein DH09_13760 [Bacillaceae bacterium JMAK1]|nr:hypothetical protein DH09_13760 [Bacillaceae bacterium JMAK1]
MRVAYQTLFRTAILLALSLSGCSNDESVGATSELKEHEKVTVAYSTDLNTFDPVFGSAGSDHSLLYPLYDTLISFDEDLFPQPGLAEEWEYLDDTTLELRLREGVLFHDGTIMDATAVAFNLERAASEESYISDLNAVETVEVIDNLTVRLHLQYPDSSIVLALADRAGMMVSKEAIEQNPDTIQRAGVGAGPYELVAWETGERITYRKFDDYWAEGEPKAEILEIQVMPNQMTRMNALQTGEIDFATSLPAGEITSLSDEKKFTIIEGSAVPVNMLYLNITSAPLDQKAVRLALQHGIDRNALNEAIHYGQGEGAYQPFPSSYWVHNEALNDLYDPDYARKVLEEEDLVGTEVTIAHYPEAYDERVIDILRHQLAEVGIVVNGQAMEIQAGISAYFDEKSVPSFMSRWTGRPDPQMTMTMLYHSTSYYNTGSYSTEEIEGLLAEAAGTIDNPERRAEIYDEVNEIGLKEEAIFIPLTFQPDIVAMSTDVKGYEPNMLGKPKFQMLYKEP